MVVVCSVKIIYPRVMIIMLKLHFVLQNNPEPGSHSYQSSLFNFCTLHYIFGSAGGTRTRKPLWRQILSLLCIPIPPPRLTVDYDIDSKAKWQSLSYTSPIL